MLNALIILLLIVVIVLLIKRIMDITMDQVILENYPSREPGDKKLIMKGNFRILCYTIATCMAILALISQTSLATIHEELYQARKHASTTVELMININKLKQIRHEQR